ncbi:hypothetical protein DICVIV_06423 [Dictyocaulus viviparus]|uniref:Ephrin RBD domain-containing protein n=1 Tax=Dictyocaulus viviparus TaxID=29172 RepID=A0A0D8XSH3_DICVI|nr:hypothetical protein DICVIV_06423 [Dictyocaulus viviparus]
MVSEKTFAECMYDVSAEWIGECTPQTNYVTVTLRPFSFISTTPIYNQNTTYFFTSFSSEIKDGYGMGDEQRNLCSVGVRLILEVRDLTVRVPLLPRSSALNVKEVPVQRVSYGGPFIHMYKQGSLTSNVKVSSRNVIGSSAYKHSSFFHENVRISRSDEAKLNSPTSDYVNHNCNNLLICLASMKTISTLVLPLVIFVIDGI